MKTRIFKIIDLDCDCIVEISHNQKEIFSWMDEYIENLQYDWFDGSDDTFEILYEDGSCDYINQEYNGHKIRKKNIVSLIYNNACTAMVYGGFSINEYGVVSVCDHINITPNNILEVTGTK